ncbi:MAG: riboflavin synthase [Candidatus Marinimicrobia bacterium]|nr:riboflavin synthase [Candidatus Neomarinimicrobiota bacterium]
MFTGLIEEVGKIKGITPISEGKEFHIESKKVINDLNIGDSITIDGACLTVTAQTNEYFSVQAVEETLIKTTLKGVKVGSSVNLERAMLATDRFGGHFVQGHVDGIAKIISFQRSGKAATLKFKIPDEIVKYVVLKGSITLNGISLTAAEVNGSIVTVSLIPFTLENTNLGQKKAGDSLNIEVDLLAKYVENFLKSKEQKTISVEKIKTWGYGKK